MLFKKEVIPTGYSVESIPLKQDHFFPIGFADVKLSDAKGVGNRNSSITGGGIISSAILEGSLVVSAKNCIPMMQSLYVCSFTGSHGLLKYF